MNGWFVVWLLATAASVEITFHTETSTILTIWKVDSAAQANLLQLCARYGPLGFPKLHLLGIPDLGSHLQWFGSQPRFVGFVLGGGRSLEGPGCSKCLNHYDILWLRLSFAAYRNRTALRIFFCEMEWKLIRGTRRFTSKRFLPSLISGTFIKSHEILWNYTTSKYKLGISSMLNKFNCDSSVIYLVCSWNWYLLKLT